MERAKSNKLTTNCGSKSLSYGDGKEAIFNAAFLLFTKKGFKQTTLKDLSEESGANTALISYYFGSKKGLMKAVLEKKLGSFDDTFNPIEELGEALSVDAFLEFIDRALSNFEKDPSFFQVYQWNYMDGGQFAKEISETICQKAEAKIAKAIQIIKPELKDEEAMSLVLMVGAWMLRYSELCWHYPNFRKFPKSHSEMRRIFKKNIKEQIRQLLS